MRRLTEHGGLFGAPAAAELPSNADVELRAVDPLREIAIGEFLSRRIPKHGEPARRPFEDGPIDGAGRGNENGRGDERYGKLSHEVYLHEPALIRSASKERTSMRKELGLDPDVESRGVPTALRDKRQRQQSAAASIHAVRGVEDVAASLAVVRWPRVHGIGNRLVEIQL